MKTITAYILPCILFCSIVAGCKKETVTNNPEALLVTTNVVIGGTSIKLGANRNPVSNNNFNSLILNTDQNGLYLWPTGDSAHPYFTDTKFSCAAGETYSLFVFGPVASPEGFYKKDTIPYITDSSFGVRVVNLATNTGSKPINITLTSAPTVNEVSSLAYRGYTGFKLYPGKFNSSYTFEVRNDTCASPKPPLATFAFASSSIPRFANITLVVRQNGTNGIAVLRVNNDR